jgi:hypothetical protein
MANIKAQASGNWSATDTWAGGVLPGPDDIAIANGFTVTIDQDIQIQRLSNTTFGSSTNDGYFLISSIPEGVIRNVYASQGLGNISGDHARGLASSYGLLTVTAASGTLNLGDTQIKSGTTTFSSAVFVSGTAGDITITCSGDIFGNTGSSGHGIDFRATTGILIVEDVYGGAVSGSNGISSLASFLKCKNVYGFTGTAVRTFGLDPVIEINSVTNSSSSVAVSIEGNFSAVTVFGEVIGSSTNVGGIGVRATGDNSVLDFQAGVYAGTEAFAVTSTTSRILTRFRGPIVNNLKKPALDVLSLLMYNNNEGLQTSMTVYDTLNNPVELKNYHAGSPEPQKVRDGVFYGPNNQLRGLVKVPNPNSVSVGVTVDGELGTAVLTGDAVFESEIAPGVPIKTRINNIATISSTGEQLKAGLS